MAQPSFYPLLNSIAVNEAKGELLLQTWADATADPQLKSALSFVAIREGEHAAAFTKRLCELGCEVDEGSAFKVFDDFDALVSCAGSQIPDAEVPARGAHDTRCRSRIEYYRKRRWHLRHRVPRLGGRRSRA